MTGWEVNEAKHSFSIKFQIARESKDKRDIQRRRPKEPKKSRMLEKKKKIAMYIVSSDYIEDT